jgi:uncharacterized protein
MTYRLGEFHAFGEGRFLYLVPSAGIFELDDPCRAVLARLKDGETTREELAAIASADVIDELHQAHAITTSAVSPQLQQPPADFPLQTLVMNLTNQCTLS